VQAGSELAALYEEIERKYRPDQPRVPAGVPEGGQWTVDGAGSVQRTSVREESRRSGENDARVLSDVTPDDDAKPGAQHAQNRRPGSQFRQLYINGRVVEPTPGQAARLAVVEAQARDAIRRVNELDPTWKPAPSQYETVEGYISAYEADVEQARGRLSELTQNGIDLGPFAVEGIPARGPERDFTAAERKAINELGTKFGCHTCGTKEPGTRSGNYILDHRPSTGWNPLNRKQYLYPHCMACSNRQGFWILRNGGRR
jgi:hypothetical protein